MVKTIKADELKALLIKVFKSLNVGVEHAEVIADSLVNSNLRCVDSHGVSRGLDFINGIKVGEINPRPNIRVLKESEISVLIDGDRGIGIPIAHEVTMRVIDKAKKYGVGVGAARNLWNVGALAYYVMKVANEGLIGISFANSKARIGIPGIKSALVGTNPIAFAIPTGDGPIVLDMALSTVAVGKIVLAARKGEKIPEGWAVTKEGKPTTDPKEALEGYLTPMGGYKGLGLAIIVDILSGIFVGAPYSLIISGKGPYTQGGFVIMGLSPKLFRSYEEFIHDVKSYVETLKSLPKEAGVEVLMPGEPEARCYDERVVKGVPLDDGVWEQLVKVMKELGVNY
ncbi:MAG: Ldh family oxidoreductase [Sulfolobales archaeon]|nr:Ldh family oxidoreductase [Sulfolobales archaeon]MCX8186626.1 Ldh family oxidoreductase [Sulfolobales archaeon]MDW7969921.1 Ldh family oxidoreductase [Sulfolobales archaeon]